MDNGCNPTYQDEYERYADEMVNNSYNRPIHITQHIGDLFIADGATIKDNGIISYLGKEYISY